MTILYRTNIDAAQRLVYNMTLEVPHTSHASPLVGDTIIVFENERIQVRMKVVSRTWLNNCHDLKIELGLDPCFENITKFEEFLKNKNL